MSEEHLSAIAAKIKFAISVAVQASYVAGLTKEDLDAFANYVSRQHSVGWVVDPTSYRDALHAGQFEEAKRRVDVLRSILALTPPDYVHPQIDPENTGPLVQAGHMRVFFVAVPDGD